MGWRSSVVLLALLAGLGVVLWLTDDAPVVDQPVLTEPVLGGRSLVEAERIVAVPGPDALPIEFERDATGIWRVVEPVRDAASVAVLDALRIAYDSARLVVAYEADEVDDRLLAETGLERPQAALRVAWPDGSRIELELGLPSPFGDDLFARRTEPGAPARIYRVHRALRNALNLTPHDAREHLVFRMLPVHAADVRIVRRGIRSDGGDDVLVLERRGTGWTMEEPAAVRIDQGQAESFVQALLGLRIDDFLPGRPDQALSPIGPEKPPDVTIALDGDLGREVVDLYFLGDGDALIGVHHDRGVWFSCDPRGYRRIVEAPIRALRAYWLLGIPVESMESIRITPPGGPVLELERRAAGAYRLVRPIAFEADPTAVSELLQGLRSLSVIDFAADDVTDFDPYGLGDAAVELEVGQGHGRGERLRLGADTGDASAWVRRVDEPHVATVPREAVERVRRPWWVYVDHRVLKIEEGARVRRIVRRLPDATEVVFERGDDGRWRREGAGEPLPLVADTFDLLRDLRAATVAPVDAFDAPVDEGQIELIAHSGQVVATLGLARAPDGRALVAIADAPGVLFVLGARDSRDVLALL